MKKKNNFFFNKSLSSEVEFENNPINKKLNDISPITSPFSKNKLFLKQSTFNSPKKKTNNSEMNFFERKESKYGSEIKKIEISMKIHQKEENFGISKIKKNKILKNLNFEEEKKKKKNLILSKNNNKIQIDKLTIKNLKLLFLSQKNEINLKKINYENRIFLFYVLHRKMNKTPNPKIKYFNFKKINLIYEKIQYFKVYFHLNKRFEEIFKFFFKAFINYKKKTMFKNELKIYYHYFYEISKKENIDLQNFFDPTKKQIYKKKQNYLNEEINKNNIFIKFSEKKIKCFNYEYFKLILQSISFKNDFLNFIEDKIEKIYLKVIKKKLVQISNLIMQKEIGNLNVKEIMYSYLIKNNQCKLPWTISELKEAKEKIIKKMNKLI